jgi:hypothetical protein
MQRAGGGGDKGTNSCCLCLLLPGLIPGYEWCKRLCVTWHAAVCPPPPTLCMSFPPQERGWLPQGAVAGFVSGTLPAGVVMGGNEALLGEVQGFLLAQGLVRGRGVLILGGGGQGKARYPGMWPVSAVCPAAGSSPSCC